MVSNNIFYNTLNDINCLFEQNKFFSNITIMQNRLFNKITMTYINKCNLSNVFKIEIQNKNDIVVRVPLHTKNYYFSTKFNSIIKTFDFIQLHVSLNNNYNKIIK